MSDTQLRIANASGFFGDRLSAAREMVEGGPTDVLTGDYLAELTMAILHKGRARDPALGYAGTFLRQMEEVLGTCIDRGVRVVTNAGGLNPAGLAAALEKLVEGLGLDARVAYVEGDDLLDALPALQQEGCELRHLDDGRPLGELGAKPLTANAYLGGFGIAKALELGADVVVCPRVTDASLVVGPAVWRFGWARDDWDRLAAAVVVGHVIECGAQCTGGNYAFFEEVPGLERPGFPIAELHEDGTAVITKHPGTGGLVSTGTVTAQLLYEIAGPAYANPDAIARFDSIELTQEGPDRVRVSGVRGEPAPPDLKLCVNYEGGFRNSVTFLLAGLDVEKKAELAERTLFAALGGRERFAHVDVQLTRSDRPDPASYEEALASLTITVKDPDPRKVGRAFSNRAVEMILASYPGFALTSPPSGERAYAVYWPTLVPRDAVGERVVLGGEVFEVPSVPTSERTGEQPAQQPALPEDEPGEHEDGPTVRVPLGRVAGARSGDKGGNANVGLWVRDAAAFEWLDGFLTTERFKALVPEARELAVERYRFPNLRALNFVVVGLLGEGVASSTRTDPQAKALGEYLRARVVPVPQVLIGQKEWEKT